MNGSHAGSVGTREGAFFDFADGFLESGNRWVAVTRINESLLLAAKDLIDLLHRVIGERCGGVDRCGDGHRVRERTSLARMHEFGCDVAFCHKENSPAKAQRRKE